MWKTTSLEQSADQDQLPNGRSKSYLPDEGLHRDHVGRWAQGEARPLHFGRVDPCDYPKCG